MYQMCNMMRESDGGEDEDFGPKFHTFVQGSLSYLSGKFFYESCKRFKHEVYGDVGRFTHDLSYEFLACSQDKVGCKKAEIECLGTCAGSDTSHMFHDFHTTVSISELGSLVLGDDLQRARANCTTRTHIFEVPLFKGGDSFKTFAARLRVRSGMTALGTHDPRTIGTFRALAVLTCYVFRMCVHRPRMVYRQPVKLRSHPAYSRAFARPCLRQRCLPPRPLDRAAKPATASRSTASIPQVRAGPVATTTATGTSSALLH